MYATNGLLGFESLFPSFFGAQSPQIPVKPSPEVQTLLDAAAKLPKADQLAGYEKALDAALVIKDRPGIRITVRTIRDYLVKFETPAAALSQLQKILNSRQTDIDPYMQSQLLFRIASLLLSADRLADAIQATVTAMESLRGLNADSDLLLVMELNAQIHRKLKNFKTSARAYLECVSLARAIGNKSVLASLLSSLGNTQIDAEEIDNGITSFNEALIVYRSLGEQIQTESVLYRLGKAYSSAKRIEQSIAAYEQSSEISKQLNRHSNQIVCQFNIGLLLLKSGEWARAQSVWLNLLDLCVKDKDHETRASVYGNLVETHRELGELKDSLECAQNAYELRKQIGNQSATAYALDDLADAYFRVGDLAKSIHHYEISLSIRRLLNDIEGETYVLGKLTGLVYRQGNTTKALELSKESIRRSESILDVQIRLTVLVSSALHLCEIKQFNLADTTIDIGLGLLELVRDFPLKARVLKVKGLILHGVGNLLLADNYLSKAVDIYRLTKDVEQLAKCLCSLANVYESQGLTGKAITLTTEALALSQTVQNKSAVDVVSLCHADNLVVDGKLTEALLIYESLEAQATSTIQTKKKTLIRGRIAAVLVKQGQLDKGAKILRENCEYWRSNSDQELLCVDLSRLASIYDLRGETQNTRQLWDEIRRKQGDIGNPLAIADVTYNIAGMNVKVGDFNLALDMYSESLRIYKSCGALSGIARSLSGIGTIYSTLGKFANAIDSFNESVKIFKDIGNVGGEADVLTNIGVINLLRGKIDDANQLFNDALIIRQRLNDKSAYVNSCINIGIVAAITGRYADALRILHIGLDECKSSGNLRQMAVVLTNLAGVSTTLGLKDASEYRLESLRLFSQQNDPMGSYYALIEMGIAELNVSKPELSLDLFRKARTIRVDLQLAPTIADLHIGQAMTAMGSFKQGRNFLRAAQLPDSNTALYRVKSLISLAIAERMTGKSTQSNESLMMACQLAIQARNPDDIAKVYSALADHALAMKDRDVAIIHLKRAIEARQVQRRGSIGLDDAMTASLSLKVAPDYRKLAGLLTDAGRLGEAMEVAELLKRSEAKVRGGDIASETPAAQGKVSNAEAAYRKAAEDLGKLGDRERFLSKVKYPSDSVKAEIAAMPAKLKVANKALSDALNRVIAQEKAAGSAAGRMRDTGAAQARLAATLKRLGPGYGAVTVLCLPDSIRFLISTPNSLTMKRVTVAEKSLVGQVKALRDTLLDPTSDPIPSAKALHTVLWAPIESELKRLGVKHVLLSLTGTARYVPFGALHNGTQYVAQGWGLSLYSPTVLEHIGDRTAKQWSVLAAGNSTERTVDDGIGSKLRFTSLPGVRAELSRVRQSVGAGPAPILDSEFTLATLKDGLTKQPSVVHLASHFQFDPRAESLSFLLTGQGEVLRASDTTVLTKDAFKGVDLLTLSACQTGTFSETADGMEVEGIASLMQRKGAGAVMSTLWPVADASTAAFMGTFYTLRAQDPRRTKAWCLREAQLRMIRGEVAPPGAPKVVATRGTTSIKVSTKGLRKDWSHPYHWAPFILQGNPL